MADLSADRQVDTKQLNMPEGGYYMDFDVSASEIIFQGMFVQGDAGGDITSAGSATVAGGAVWGLAVEHVDNSSGADGDVTAKCLVGAVIEHTLTATTADIGAAAFVTDDQTLTLTASNNAFLGYIIGMNTANTVIVKMCGPKPRGQTFVFTNFTEDLDIDCDGVVGIIGDGLATLHQELRAAGLVQGTHAA